MNLGSFQERTQEWSVQTNIKLQIASYRTRWDPKKSDDINIKGTLNSESYIDQIILGSNLIESADNEYGIGGLLFMQDNSRPHVSRETIEVLKELDIDLLPDWPPYSPDLMAW